EMARDMAQRFNYLYGEHFVLPEAAVDDQTAVLQGLDGRKMSKSYGNTTPPFLDEKQRKQHITKTKTNPLAPGEPDEADSSTLFQIWRALAGAEETAEMRREFANGIAWGEAKKRLFELLNEQLRDARDHYNRLLAEPDYIEAVLRKGADRARETSEPF